MKTTIFALVASIGIVLVAPSIASADVNTNNTDTKVTAPKGPTGKIPADADKYGKTPNGKMPADADKDAKMPNGKAPTTKVPHGKAPSHNDAHGKNAKLDCKSPKLDAKMKQMCEGQNGAKRS